MKIAIFGISQLKLGKQNIKDPRLDQADKLVEAKKKVYAQVDAIGSDDLADADAIIASGEAYPDLILQDLELVETRLSRGPEPGEQAILEQLKAQLEKEQPIKALGLGPEQWSQMHAYNFCTNKPIIRAAADELEDPDPLWARAVKDAGYISFLTVGGKENRAWLIREGTTAWEAAGEVHSDIQKGFIRAEIISFQEFVEAGGETEAKRAGKQRLETKQYVMQDYDVVNFRFSK